jgi:hypothetical protein
MEISVKQLIEFKKKLKDSIRTIGFENDLENTKIAIEMADAINDAFDTFLIQTQEKTSTGNGTFIQRIPHPSILDRGITTLPYTTGPTCIPKFGEIDAAACSNLAT